MMKRLYDRYYITYACSLLAGMSIILFCISCTTAEKQDHPQKPISDFWPTLQQLQEGKWIDLTHAFSENIPHWKGFPSMRLRNVYTYEKGGFWAQEFTHVGQWGTHIDPPAHFHKGLRTVDQILPEEMILTLVAIDVREKVKQNPDYILTLQDIRDWEARNGPIPAGSFVAMQTGWSSRWPDDIAMQNRDRDGVAHYPGWSLETLKFLYETRKITASGHETTDTDPGISTTKDNYECESYVLGTNHYQIELIANLDRVPEKGAILICTFPKPAQGSGFPARLIAITP